MIQRQRLRGAIGVLHEMAGELNAFLERNDADKAKPYPCLLVIGKSNFRRKRQPRARMKSFTW